MSLSLFNITADDVMSCLNGLSANINVFEIPGAIKKVYALVQIHGRLDVISRNPRLRKDAEDYLRSYGVEALPASSEEFFSTVRGIINAVATGDAKAALEANVNEAEANGRTPVDFLNGLKETLLKNPKIPGFIRSQIENLFKSLVPFTPTMEDSNNETVLHSGSGEAVNSGLPAAVPEDGRS